MTYSRDDLLVIVALSGLEEDMSRHSAINLEPDTGYPRFYWVHIQHEYPSGAIIDGVREIFIDSHTGVIYETLYVALLTSDLEHRDVFHAIINDRRLPFGAWVWEPETPTS